MDVIVPSLPDVVLSLAREVFLRDAQLMVQVARRRETEAMEYTLAEDMTVE